MGLFDLDDTGGLGATLFLLLTDDVRKNLGDSCAGREGCRILVLGVLPGPTDLLKLMLREGPSSRLVMYRLPPGPGLMGTKMPDPGMAVRKYRLPSTSPLFLPLCMCSLASSMPANRPGLPVTGPRYRIVPYMPPGTLTWSPTWNWSIPGMMKELKEEKNGAAKKKKKKKEGEEGEQSGAEPMNTLPFLFIYLTLASFHFINHSSSFCTAYHITCC